MLYDLQLDGEHQMGVAGLEEAKWPVRVSFVRLVWAIPQQGGLLILRSVSSANPSLERHR